MKLLREYIRELLKEDGEFGKQVFSQLAPEDSRHFGNEVNTEIEDIVFQAIEKHLSVGGPVSHLLNDHIPLIKRLMDNPSYNDVFIRYSGAEVCRGTGMSLSQARKLIPDFDNLPLEEATPRTDPRQKFEAWTQKVAVPPFEWTPRGANLASSWSTNDDRICSRYAKENADLWKDPQEPGVILYAQPTASDFLDVSELYRFKTLGKYAKEKEVLALGPVMVSAVKVYKEISSDEHAGLPDYRDRL